MKRGIATLVVCGTAVLLFQACATKNFVREQVGSTETRIGQRVDATEGQLRQTSERTMTNTQALEGASQRLQGLDSRVGEVATVADGTRRDVVALKESDEATKQRWANRNRYSALDQRAIYFDTNKSEVKDEGINELEDVVRALKADPNAVLELQGFADPRGSDRYNYQLTRERVDAVTRYLVQRHGIDLRRIHAVGMGKQPLEPGRKASRDSLAKSRRVEIRLLAPQS